MSGAVTVMALVMHVMILPVFAVLDGALLGSADLSVTCRMRFGMTVVSLTAFEGADFAIAELTLSDAVGDALLLFGVALHVVIEALRRCAVRVTVHGIALGVCDVAAELILALREPCLLGGTELAVAEVMMFEFVDRGRLVFEMGGFPRRQAAGLQALIDALLLLRIALRVLGDGGLFGGACRRWRALRPGAAGGRQGQQEQRRRCETADCGIGAGADEGRCEGLHWR